MTVCFYYNSFITKNQFKGDSPLEFVWIDKNQDTVLFKLNKYG